MLHLPFLDILQCQVTVFSAELLLTVLEILNQFFFKMQMRMVRNLNENLFNERYASILFDGHRLHLRSTIPFLWFEDCIDKCASLMVHALRSQLPKSLLRWLEVGPTLVQTSSHWELRCLSPSRCDD